jgi:hypothetical protein
MMTQTATAYPQAKLQQHRTVAVVGTQLQQDTLETILDSVDHDIVCIEAIAHAYSYIKRTLPDLVVVCLTKDDVDGCQVLSMLALDRETARIPVLAHMTVGAVGTADTRNSEEQIAPTEARFLLN